MKSLLEKATAAFAELSQQLGATLSFKELGPHQKGCDIGFEKHQAYSEVIYLWDRKHGMSKIGWELSGPSVGWTILQASVKEDATRFSFMAIYQKNLSTLDIYPTTMTQVKIWSSYSAMGLYDDYESHITSYCGTSGKI